MQGAGNPFVAMDEAQRSDERKGLLVQRREVVRYFQSFVEASRCLGCESSDCTETIRELMKELSAVGICQNCLKGQG